MIRSIGIVAGLFGSLAAFTALQAQDTPLQVKEQQIEGPKCGHIPVWQDDDPPSPCKDSDLQEWVDQARHWRSERHIRAGLNDDEYSRPELAWTQSSFVETQMMVHDRFFYDSGAHRYTVSRYLDDLRDRYGGIDSVLVWPYYPNLGIDDRNQYDLLRDLPGGMPAVRDFVAAFKARGVRVLLPTLLWDQGTRDEGEPDVVALVKLLKMVGADGINGDTLAGLPSTFRRQSDKAHADLALEPELGPASDEMLNWNAMSWGYWDYSFVPIVSRFKWLQPRHLVHVSNRLAHDHSDDLQHAFLNGVGFESWENVWGIWNGLSDRDAEALRRIAAIDRYAKAYLVSPDWRPFYPTRHFGVYASQWPGAEGTVWTIVNRNVYPTSGGELLVPVAPGMRYFDLWKGAELHPAVQGDQLEIAIDLDPRGYGAILATRTPSPALSTLLVSTADEAKKPLSSYSDAWAPLPQTLVAQAPTSPPSSSPAGMVLIPATDFVFRVNGVEIEGGNDEGVDVQYPGEISARRYHDIRVHIPTFWIDRTPVTNEQFRQFLKATHYRPSDDHNFLKDWFGGTYRSGWGNKPVTWVSIEDAKVYADWAGKRLPHEWEWQYAAQGMDGRAYPWGNQMIAANLPATDTGRRMLPPSDVDGHPGGVSPFGVMDMVGNVWQWTDEWRDEHSRAAILRGGSHYRPAGARWYFPEALKLSEHGKYLLMGPSIDRSGAVGFRCVMDSK